MQIFGDLANFNPHLHVLAADSVFGADGTFSALPPMPEALLARDFRRAVQFATLGTGTHPAITAADIQVIA